MTSDREKPDVDGVLRQTRAYLERDDDEAPATPDYVPFHGPFASESAVAPIFARQLGLDELSARQLDDLRSMWAHGLGALAELREKLSAEGEIDANAAKRLKLELRAVLGLLVRFRSPGAAEALGIDDELRELGIEPVKALAKAPLSRDSNAAVEEIEDRLFNLLGWVEAHQTGRQGDSTARAFDRRVEIEVAHFLLHSESFLFGALVPRVRRDDAAPARSLIFSTKKHAAEVAHFFVRDAQLNARKAESIYAAIRKSELRNPFRSLDGRTLRFDV